MEINLKDLIMEDLTIVLDDKKLIINRQDVFDETVRFIYTYGQEEYNNDVMKEIWKNHISGDFELFDKIPLTYMIKINDKAMEEGSKAFNNVGL